MSGLADIVIDTEFAHQFTFRFFCDSHDKKPWLTQFLKVWWNSSMKNFLIIWKLNSSVLVNFFNL